MMSHIFEFNVEFSYVYSFLVYTQYPQKTCSGKEQGRYNTLLEAKDACGKDGGCEMVSKVCEDCGTPKERQTYYRTCSGGFWEPVTDYQRMLSEYFETWIKGSIIFLNAKIINIPKR